MPALAERSNRWVRAGRRMTRGASGIATGLAGRGALIGVTLILIAAFANIAALKVASVDGNSPTLVQTPAPVTLTGLFDPDMAELKATPQLNSAIKNAYGGGCYPPRATFKVVVPTTTAADPLFLATLARARAEALAADLPKLGLEEGQFKTESAMSGTSDAVQVSYDKFNEDDKDPPKFIKVTSIPKEGAKVNAGQQISVTITTSERFQDGHKSWPTGVSNIQLTADDGLVDSKDYGRRPEPCATPTWPAKPYTVPRNPPPAVHLLAIVEDASGHKDSRDIVFYTVGHWHGTSENFSDITTNDGVETVRDVRHQVVTFDLYETSKDKLEGEAYATWTSSQEVPSGKCAGQKMIQDPKTVVWHPKLSGTIQRRPDGTAVFNFQATPDRGPSYKLIETAGGECKGGEDQGNPDTWKGFSFSLKPGKPFDYNYAAPLGAGETGTQYSKSHVEWVDR